MSRELNRKQKQIILSEIQRNKVLELENPYVMSADIFKQLKEENDHETMWQNANYFLHEFKQNDDDEYYLGRWESVKYDAWVKDLKGRVL